MIEFEWDSTKARSNLRKHRVGFNEAVSVLRDPKGITIFDPDHSDEEDRYLTVGVSVAGRFLLVSHTDRTNRIRVISARKLTPVEREAYENELKKRHER